VPGPGIGRQRPPLHPHRAQGTLFIARLRAADGPRGTPTPTGTGAFVLEVRDRLSTLRWELTYDGLDAPPAAIHLRNTGEGSAGGRVVQTLCGEDADGRGPRACPPAAGATLSGTWTSASGLTPELVREVAARRVYVEVRTGRPALRGHLLQQRLMAHSIDFTARVTGPGTSGTGAFHLIQFGDGAEELQFEITVTGDGDLGAVDFVSQDRAVPLATAAALPAGQERVGNTVSGTIRSESSAANLLTVADGASRDALAEGRGSLRVTTQRPSRRISAAIVPVP
jgi:hypothetical protein